MADTIESVARRAREASFSLAGVDLEVRNRALEAIIGEDHSGRPLVGSQPDKLRKLYAERIELYRKYAQYTISNTDTAEAAAEQIADLYRKEEQK